MTELTDTLKREHEAAEECNICLKEFAHDEQQGDNDCENRKVRYQRHYTVLVDERPTTIAT